MDTTQNYKLNKPSTDDFVDITVLNENADTIDSKLKELADSAEGATATLKAKADLDSTGKVPTEQLPAMDYIPTDQKGAVGGVATLGSDGKVPAGQLPAMDYDAKGSAAAVQTNLDTHTSNTSNPHNVTYDQVGAAAASHTHSGSDLTSAVPISLGGTGATTAADAMTNLGGMLTDMSNAALGLTWEKATLPSSIRSYSVCYGNGKFVAVGYSYSKKAFYSTDGINWTAATLPSYEGWRSVCYGNGKFVVVASNSTTAAYSTDGITWTKATMPSSVYWQSVCYGNGKFVAVSDSKTAAYSTDGINWTSVTLPNSAGFVCYGNDKFVAIYGSSPAAIYSTDGITWTGATLPSPGLWYSICYGDGKFVALPGGNSTAAYSTDGITWTAATLPSSVYWWAVCYGGGKFVAVGGSAAIYSTDGINWAEATLPNSSNSVCYGDGKFVAVTGGTETNIALVASATPSAISQLNAAGLTRMQLVSYVGTGTYGGSNPSSLTFDFAPKVVLYLGSSVDNSVTLKTYTKRAMFLDSLVTNNVTGMGFSLDVNSYPSYGGKNEDGKGVHWYGGNSAANQLNSSGYTYYFLALA